MQRVNKLSLVNEEYNRLSQIVYINGLRDEIKIVVEAQVPATVDQATIIAKIRQRALERNKFKATKHATTAKPQNQFQRNNDACVKIHNPQINALALNDLDRPLSEEVLNQFVVQDIIVEEFYNLSINAIFGTEGSSCLKLSSLVNKKVMLMLVDSESSSVVPFRKLTCKYLTLELMMPFWALASYNKTVPCYVARLPEPWILLMNNSKSFCKHKTEIEKQVKKLLEARLITHSPSPFVSPILVVQKKDVSWRPYVAYRKLNEVTIKT
ncbi:hypothetical protein U9M48_001339 [Paspalum notatum var. saurae]|uniref:RNA-directed DNA polymerase-like protein n=1 Tax=Paspalum notatum var. saurae TaxID=547442 RepID=A0AAQ3SF42_PASNO